MHAVRGVDLQAIRVVRIFDEFVHAFRAVTCLGSGKFFQAWFKSSEHLYVSQGAYKCREHWLPEEKALNEVFTKTRDFEPCPKNHDDALLHPFTNMSERFRRVGQEAHAFGASYRQRYVELSAA